MLSKEELVKVFLDTRLRIKEKGYTNQKGQWINFENLESQVKWSKFYQKLSKLDTSKRPVYNTKIYVQNIDTFLKAQEMGYCAVLNMASYRCPGGGVKNGSKAQEEELCRRSTLVKSLYKYTDNKENNDLSGVEPGKDIYPIPMYGGIYSPGVEVFKSSISYSFLDKPFKCNVISVPAFSHPEIDTRTGDMLDKYATIFKGKIRAIYRIALCNHQVKLVLGAFGCGAYACPPRHVARLFKQVLEEPEFKNHFKEICFAILEDRNSRKNNAGGNIKPFKEVFSDDRN